MVADDKEGGCFSIIRRLRAVAEGTTVPREMNPVVSPDFFHLFTHWKPDSQDYDEFISQVQHTREYCFFTLAAIIEYAEYRDRGREVVFREIQDCLSDLTSSETKARLQAVEDKVRDKPLRLARAEMIGHILMTVCWQLIDKSWLFPIPLCGDIRSLDSLKQRVDAASAQFSDASPTPVLVDFCTSIFASAKAALWAEHPEYVLTPREIDRDLFGWTAGWTDGWKWEWLLETAEGGVRIRRDLQDEKNLISFESYRDFFVKRGCQIIGAYSDAQSGYEYRSENGKEPPDNVDGHEHDWEWAKRRYQHGFGRNRPERLGYPRPPYYVTLSFSVPVDDVARPSPSGLTTSPGRPREGVPTYAVYAILDLLHLSPGRVAPLGKITQALYGNIDDLRLIATRQLAREALTEKQRLAEKSETLFDELRNATMPFALHHGHLRHFMAAAVKIREKVDPLAIRTSAFEFAKLQSGDIFDYKEDGQKPFHSYWQIATLSAQQKRRLEELLASFFNELDIDETITKLIRDRSRQWTSLETLWLLANACYKASVSAAVLTGEEVDAAQQLLPSVEGTTDRERKESELRLGYAVAQLGMWHESEYAFAIRADGLVIVPSTNESRDALPRLIEEVQAYWIGTRSRPDGGGSNAEPWARVCRGAAGAIRDEEKSVKEFLNRVYLVTCHDKRAVLVPFALQDARTLR